VLHQRVAGNTVNWILNAPALCYSSACAFAAVALADMTTPDPKYALDGLYTVLGLLLGVNAFNERRALTQVLQEKQQQLQQLQQQQDTAAAGAAASGSSASGSISSEQ
jgi:hypothetical protein